MAMTKSQRREPVEFTDYRYKVKADAVGYKGGVVVAASDGYAKPGLTATGLRILGIAAEDYDATGLDDGDLDVLVEKSTAENGHRRAYWLKNDATTAVDQGDVEASVYLKDDETVSADSTGRTAAGKCHAVDADLGVLVELDD